MSATPYQPQSNGNGNGHSNGNGVFSLTPKEDPVYAHILPQARREVQLDNSLHPGARLLFDYLTDCSVWAGRNVRPGVFRISNSDLARLFQVSSRTIQKYKQALRARGRIWTTDKHMKNTYPLTEYHITAVVGQVPLPFNVDIDGGYLAADDNVQMSNRHRVTPQKRGHRGRWAKIEPNTANPAQSAESQDRASVILPPPTEPRDVRRTSQTSAVARPKVPPSHVPDFRPPTSQTSAVGGSPVPATHEPNDVRGTSQTSVFKEAQGREVSLAEGEGRGTPPDSAFERWIKGLDRMLPSHWDKLAAQFAAEMKSAKTAAAKDLLKRKLAAVRERLDGPTVRDEVPTAPTVKVADIAMRQPTAEELEASRAFLAERKARAR